MAQTRVILKLRVDITFNTEREFWTALAEVKDRLINRQITHSACVRDTVTHDIPALAFDPEAE